MLRLSILILALGHLSAQIPCSITTIAGPASLFSGDGGPASLAYLNSPSGFRFDAAGNLYIADTGNHRIRVVTPDGVINTIAGTGVAGYSGDGGPAVAAQLNAPVAVSADRNGNVYIADRDNHRIRKIGVDGAITTVAGTGSPNFGGDGGPAVAGVLQSPVDVIMDGAGNLFISDRDNFRVRMVSGASGMISTVAGSGYNPSSPGPPPDRSENSPAILFPLLQPAGLALDAAGNLYIADNRASRVWRVDHQGLIDTFAGTSDPNQPIGDGGPATAAYVSAPLGLAFDSRGDLAIASNGGIRMVLADQTIATVNPRTAFYVGFNSRDELLFNNGFGAIFSNASTLPVYGLAPRGNSGDGGPAIEARVLNPAAVAVDRKGNIFVADSYAGVIRKITPDGNIGPFAGTGSFSDSGDGGPATQASLGFITSIALDQAGNLYSAEFFGGHIRRIDLNGMITTVADVSQSSFLVNQIAVDTTGAIFFSGYQNSIYRLDKNGVGRNTVQGLLATDPNGVVFAIIAADLARAAGDGSWTTVRSLKSTPGFNAFFNSTPFAVDASGNAFILAGNMLFESTSDGRVSAVSKDDLHLPYINGPASQVTLGYMNQFAVDQAGNLYFGDVEHASVRSLSSGCQP